jgi:CheY-like chemotaxis protein
MQTNPMCVLLVDDNPDDNFFHEREIKKHNPAITVIAKVSGKDALQYLISRDQKNYLHPDIIFVDINMPGMNGWEFLMEYDQLDKELKSRIIVIMLTTSETSEDIEKSKTWDFVTDFITKPLTRDKIGVLIGKYFN